MSRLTAKERAHAEELRDQLMDSSPSTTLTVMLKPTESGECPAMDRSFYELLQERVRDRARVRKRR